MIKPVFLIAVISVMAVTACNMVSMDVEEAGVTTEAENIRKQPDQTYHDDNVAIDGVPMAEICAAARDRNAEAQYKVAKYYNNMVNSGSLPHEDGENVSRSEKAMAAAMFWYDLAIHYGYKAQDLVATRKEMGRLATKGDFELFRKFSENKDNPYCLPSEVFGKIWY